MSEQNEKLTAEEIQKVLHAAYLRDGEPTSATITYLHHLFQSKAAQQVEHATAEAKERIKKLEETSILRVLSITIIAEGYRKEAAELRHKLEQDGDEKEAIIKDTKASLFEATQQLAELRKELERQKEIAESLAKERWSLRDELSEAQRQRDEANTILRQFKRLAAHGNLQDLADFDAKVCDHLSRLSSGETKPSGNPNSYPIMFHLLSEENAPYPEENVLWYRDGEPPYSGSMLDEDFPGIAYFFAWCNIPAPPESLTDKPE